MNAPINRERLAKLLGLLAASHNGQVITAARCADALVRQAALTWHDVVAENDAQPQLDLVRFGVANEIRFCPLHRHRLAEWEQTFWASIRHRSAPWSARQCNRLNSIVDKLRVRGEAA